jgi:hypothetical protein
MTYKQIPEAAPYIPRLIDPADIPPQNGERFHAADVDLGSGRRFTLARVTKRLEHWQYWNCILTKSYPCGEYFKQEEKVTVGAKQQLIAEVGSKLGVGLNGVSAELSTKLQASVTVSEERETTYTIQKTAPKCDYLKLTCWQLVDEYAIHEQVTLLGLTSRHPRATTLTSRRAYYHDEHLYWQHPACCNNAIPEKGRQYVLDFPDGRVIVPGGANWRPGDLVPASALPNDLAALVAPQQTSVLARVTELQTFIPLKTRDQALERLTFRVRLQTLVVTALPLVVAGLVLLFGGTLNSILGLTGVITWIGQWTGIASRLVNAAPGFVAIVLGLTLLILVRWLRVPKAERPTRDELQV